MLEESAALRAAATYNGRHGVADMRSRRRNVYLHDDGPPDDQYGDFHRLNFEETYQFHERRSSLIDQFTVLTSRNK